MSFEYGCMLAVVLMYGTFLLRVWLEMRRATRLRLKRQRIARNTAESTFGGYDTRQMHIGSSAELMRLAARARLHEMRAQMRMSESVQQFHANG